jgi:hypothetical protein
MFQDLVLIILLIIFDLFVNVRVSESKPSLQMEHWEDVSLMDV